LLKSGQGFMAAESPTGGKRSPEPRVVVYVGQDVFQSTAPRGSLSPVWEHGNVRDFLIFDAAQKITVLVYDHDDLIGGVRGVPVRDFARGGQVIDETLPIRSMGKQAGTLSISTRWFVLSDSVPLSGIHAAVARGPSQLLLSVKVVDVQGLSADDLPPFRVHVRVGKSHEAKTTASVPREHRLVGEEIRRVCRELAGRGFSPQEIGDITRLTPGQVQRSLADERRSSKEVSLLAQQRAAEHPAFDQILRLLLPWTEEMMRTAAVSLELRDKAGLRVGRCFEVPLSEVVGKDVTGPFVLAPRIALQANLSTRWLQLP